MVRNSGSCAEATATCLVYNPVRTACADRVLGEGSMLAAGCSGSSGLLAVRLSGKLCCLATVQVGFSSGWMGRQSQLHISTMLLSGSWKNSCRSIRSLSGSSLGTGLLLNNRLMGKQHSFFCASIRN